MTQVELPLGNEYSSGGPSIGGRWTSSLPTLLSTTAPPTAPTRNAAARICRRGEPADAERHALDERVDVDVARRDRGEPIERVDDRVVPAEAAVAQDLGRERGEDDERSDDADRPGRAALGDQLR
jgi:hypothetical protein